MSSESTREYPGVSVGEVVLFVCRANVCRSPIMQYAFETAMGAERGEITTASRGTDVRDSDSLCAISARECGPDEQARAFTGAHTPTQLIVPDVDAAGLIIVATREERGKVAKLMPDARRRTFTLAEAVRLAKHATFAPIPAHNDEEEWPVAAFASGLDAVRARTAPRPARGNSSPDDVLDGHHRAPWAHRAAVRRARELADALGQEIIKRR